MPNCSDKWGFAPDLNYFFVLTQKSNQKKSRLCPLSTKNQRLTAKIFLNSPDGSNRKDFLKLSSLVFRLTGQGQSA
jgi:hypothetical protein